MDPTAFAVGLLDYLGIILLGDNMQNSLWAKNSQYTKFPQLNRDVYTDVLIVGGGLAGVLCAYTLKCRGVSCVLIEADRIGSGVTRNTTAKITSQHGLVYHKLLRKFGVEKTRLYWQLNERAVQQYRSLAKVADFDFETKDNYIYAIHSSHKLEEEMEALQRLGIPADLVTDLPLPFETAGAIRFQRQGQMDPLKLIYAISEGLDIYEQTTAREFVGNKVVTDHGVIHTSKIIVATHFPILNKHGAYFAKLYQNRSYVVAMENAVQLDGMYLDEAENGLSFRNYGEYLLLGDGGHRTGKPGAGWSLLEEKQKAFYPNAKITNRWATQDCMTLDGIPYIGQYSKNTPDLYVATGFNKWGMSSSMAAAMVLSDLVQGKKNPFAEVFSPSRSVLHPQLLVNLWDSAVNLARFTKPRCPHLGCALRWNPQERSWDCPCHGSRFSETGELLDNPATDDLNL